MVTVCRGSGEVNPALWTYAFNVALLNRPDASNLTKKNFPLQSEYFPAKYVDGQIIRRARQEASIAEITQNSVSYSL